jgi:hypothetical protein
VDGDLAATDMGVRIVEHAQDLLQKDGAARVLSQIWCMDKK